MSPERAHRTVLPRRQHRGLGRLPRHLAGRRGDRRRRRDPRPGMGGEILPYYTGALTNFPVHHDDPHTVHVAGDTITVEITFTGETVDGVPSTFEAVDVFTLEDGLIRRLTTWYDIDTSRRASCGTPGTPERRLGRSCGMRRHEPVLPPACSRSSRSSRTRSRQISHLVPVTRARRDRSPRSSSRPRRRTSGRSSPGASAPSRSPGSTSRSAAASGAMRSCSARSAETTRCWRPRRLARPHRRRGAGAGPLRLRRRCRRGRGHRRRRLDGAPRGLASRQRACRRDRARAPRDRGRRGPASAGTMHAHTALARRRDRRRRARRDASGSPRQAAAAVGDRIAVDVARRDVSPDGATCPGMRRRRRGAMSLLLSPIEVGSVEVKNRVAFTAHGSFLDFYRPGVSGEPVRRLRGAPGGGRRRADLPADRARPPLEPRARPLRRTSPDDLRAKLDDDGRRRCTGTARRSSSSSTTSAASSAPTRAANFEPLWAFGRPRQRRGGGGARDVRRPRSRRSLDAFADDRPDLRRGRASTASSCTARTATCCSSPSARGGTGATTNGASRSPSRRR